MPQGERSQTVWRSPGMTIGPFALETDPSLTTLDMELEHLGAAAVSDLFAVIGGARVGGGTRHHEGTLVITGSTDPRLS